MSRPLRRSILALVLVALAAVATVGLSEARRTAGRNARLAEQLAAALDARDAATASREALAEELGEARDAGEAAAAAAKARIAYLEDELSRALDQVGAVNARVAERRAELEALERRAKERWREVNAPMPEGVRLAVRALTELLRDDGYERIRVLRARAIEDGALTDVELVERSPDGFGFAYFRASRLRVELDRATGSLRLVLDGGHALRDGEVEALDENGAVLALTAVDGPVWEARVPYLLTATGEYPEDAAAAPRRRGVDPITAAAWAGRLDGLLAEADVRPRWSVRRVDDLVDGELRGVLLVATAEGLLEATASARRAVVEIDRAAGAAWLVLLDGRLRRESGTTTIPEAGYRILLAGVAPARASELMLGLVAEAGATDGTSAGPPSSRR